MTRIIVDETLRSKLQNFVQPLELCDDSGRILAHLIPALNSSRYDLEPKINHEEFLRRLHAKEKSYTTAEVLAYLEKL
jgi:hypothetical protein